MLGDSGGLYLPSADGALWCDWKGEEQAGVIVGEDEDVDQATYVVMRLEMGTSRLMAVVSAVESGLLTVPVLVDHPSFLPLLHFAPLLPFPYPFYPHRHYGSHPHYLTPWG